MPVREKGRRGPGSQRARPFSRPHASTDRRKSGGSSGTAAVGTAQTDSLLEGDGFEPSVPARRKLSRSDYVGCIRASRKVGVNENDNTRTPGAYAGPMVRIRLPPARSLLRT